MKYRVLMTTPPPHFRVWAAGKRREYHVRDGVIEVPQSDYERASRRLAALVRDGLLEPLVTL